MRNGQALRWTCWSLNIHRGAFVILVAPSMSPVRRRPRKRGLVDSLSEMINLEKAARRRNLFLGSWGDSEAEAKHAERSVV